MCTSLSRRYKGDQNGEETRNRRGRASGGEGRGVTMRVSKLGGGKRTRNSCRSGTTFGRVSPHREPHARPVSARIRAQSCTGLACERTSGESYSIRTHEIRSQCFLLLSCICMCVSVCTQPARDIHIHLYTCVVYNTYNFPSYFVRQSSRVERVNVSCMNILSAISSDRNVMLWLISIYTYTYILMVQWQQWRRDAKSNVLRLTSFR